MKKILIILFLSTGLFSFSNAQIVFDEMGVGTSYWIRTYATPDENVLLTTPLTVNGESNPVLVSYIYGRVKFGKFLGIRGKLGLAQDSYESLTILGNLERNEKLSQTIIPAGLLLDFSIPLGKKSSEGKDSKEADSEDSDSFEKSDNSGSKLKTHLIGGVGLNRYFIQHTISRDVSGGDGSIPDSRFSGNDYGITAMVGISNQISDKIILTVFSQYNSGSYNHRVYSEEVPGSYDVENISLKGLEFGLSLAYKFGK